jgi:uracil phosphoribosyltransferase
MVYRRSTLKSEGRFFRFVGSYELTCEIIFVTLKPAKDVGLYKGRCGMNQIVSEALREMASRRWNRAMTTDVYGPTRYAELAALQTALFSRREPGEAFHELNQRELAFLENIVEGYEFDGRLRVVVRHARHREDTLPEDFTVIRQNHLTGQQIVTPDEFREASGRITRSLLDFVRAEYGISAETVMVLPWRAGLAFADAAFALGIRDFYHLGACRDETTLETKIYFEEIPEVYTLRDQRKAIVADPMLPTGNTDIVAIRRLLARGVSEENIMVVAVISAPEGIYHILHEFPKVKIVVGQHDERLNNRGYIEPGLGDFGDLWFEDLGVEVAHAWRKKSILSETACTALLARMKACAEDLV